MLVFITKTADFGIKQGIVRGVNIDRLKLLSRAVIYYARERHICRKEVIFPDIRKASRQGDLTKGGASCKGAIVYSLNALADYHRLKRGASREYSLTVKVDARGNCYTDKIRTVLKGRVVNPLKAVGQVNLADGGALEGTTLDVGDVTAKSDGGE